MSFLGDCSLKSSLFFLSLSLYSRNPDESVAKEGRPVSPNCCLWLGRVWRAVRMRLVEMRGRLYSVSSALAPSFSRPHPQSPQTLPACRGCPVPRPVHSLCFVRCPVSLLVVVSHRRWRRWKRSWPSEGRGTAEGSGAGERRSRATMCVFGFGFVFGVWLVRLCRTCRAYIHKCIRTFTRVCESCVLSCLVCALSS